MVLSNHISWLDIFSLDSQLPSRFIAKAEIAKWPVFGLIAQQIGTLFINRSSKRAILRINDDIRGALCNCEAVTILPKERRPSAMSFCRLKPTLLRLPVKSVQRFSP